MREPEKQRHAARLRHDGGEHGVDRCHVRDDGGRPLARQPDEKTHRPAGPRAAAERAHTNVGRQLGRARVEREDDELVDEWRERPELGDGRAECRIVLIDALRDEDELHVGLPQRRRARVRGARTPRVSRASLDRVLAAAASRPALFVAEHATRAAAMRSGSGSKSTPFSPSGRGRGSRRWRRRCTGRPRTSASITTRPIPRREGRTSSSRRRARAATSSVSSRRVPRREPV